MLIFTFGSFSRDVVFVLWDMDFCKREREKKCLLMGIGGMADVCEVKDLRVNP